MPGSLVTLFHVNGHSLQLKHDVDERDEVDVSQIPVELEDVKLVVRHKVVEEGRDQSQDELDGPAYEQPFV